MEWDTDIVKFGAVRKIVLCFKHSLEVVSEIKREHDEKIDELYKSLLDMQDFLKEKHGVDVEMTHLVNHLQFLSDEKVANIRKKVLDYGNALKREMENT